MLIISPKKRSFFRFLLPAPLDAWVLTTLFFWGVAFVSSLALHLNYQQTDPLDISMPVAIGSLAIVLGVGATAILGKTSRRSWLLFAITLAVGIFIYVYAGKSLDMEQPQWMSMDYGEAKSRGMTEYALSYLRLAAIGLGAIIGLFLTRYIIMKAFPKAIVFANVLSAVASFLNRYRTRLMIGFVAVMLPATVVRNIVDPQMQSASFFTSATLIIGFGFCWLVGFYVLVQIASNPRWPRVKRVAIVLTCLVGGCLFSASHWTTDTKTFGYHFAMAIAPFLLVLAVISCMTLGQVRGSDSNRKRFISIWSLLIAIPVFAFVGWSIYRYDIRVFAIALLESDDFPANTKWLDHAKRSRDFQRATDGSARLIASYTSGVLHVRIRDQRDADCLQKLFRYQPTISAWFVIDNLQPFVDTTPLRTHGANLTLVGGECTSTQFADIAFKVPTLSLQATRLPTQIDWRNDIIPTNLPKIVTYGNRHIPGLAAFLDAYVPAGLDVVNIHSPTSAEDWAAIVRHNQECEFLVYAAMDEFSELGLQMLESSKERPLGGITFRGYSHIEPERMLRLMLESDIQPMYLPFDKEQASWDLAFLRPDASLNVWFQNPPGSFADHSKDYHWRYGQNQRGEITSIWLPDLELVRQHTVSLIATETLRLDSDGVCGFKAFLETDVSALAKLINLKRLYLSRDHFVSDLGFLRSMPKLQHLQMQSQDRKAMAATGLEVCKNLESIRIFGAPDPQTIADLAVLKKLKTLEIADDEAELANEADVEKLRSQLPNVNVRIIAKVDYEPDLSDDLKEHLSRVRQEARKRLLKLADEMGKNEDE